LDTPSLVQRGWRGLAVVLLAPEEVIGDHEDLLAHGDRSLRLAAAHHQLPLAPVPCSTTVRWSSSAGGAFRVRGCRRHRSTISSGREPLTGSNSATARSGRILMERLTHEVNEVMAQEVGPFLIHAAELVERVRGRGIKMVLQGSGTRSLLCYALGISPVDPLTVEALVFERFAGRHRGIGDLPDLDFAVPAGRESEVRALLIEMFGAERVAYLAAVVTL